MTRIVAFLFALTLFLAQAHAAAPCLGVGDGGTGACDAPTARANLGAAASSSNSDITGMNSLTNITPPSPTYKVGIIGGELITATDSYVISILNAGSLLTNSFYKILVPGTTNFTLIGALDNNIGTIFKATGPGSGTGTVQNATPFQGFRLNYTLNQPWRSDTTGSFSIATVSATINSNIGIVAGKGVIGFNTSMAPGVNYVGNEIYSLSGGITQALGTQLSTATDYVATTGGVTVNDTTQLGGAIGARPYGLFGTVNIGPSGRVRIINASHTEVGVTSGGIAQYILGSSQLKNGSAPEFGQTVTAGNFITTQYKIFVPGTTDFTLIGAADNNIGTIFSATGPGTGTGTAVEVPWSSAISVAAAGSGGVNQAYVWLASLTDQVPQGGNPLPQALRPEGGLIGYDNQKTCTAIGAIGAGGISTPGSGYTNSPVGFPYTLVPVTGGSGTGAYANVTVSGGVVTGFVILGLNRGTGYVVGDVLSVASASIGGTGSGFTWTVAKVSPTCPTTISYGIYLPNVYFSGGASGDIWNLTNGWVVDKTFRETIGTINLTDLNPGNPAHATDLLFTALNTRNAGSAIPAQSIPASNCGNDNDVCMRAKAGVALGGGFVGSVNIDFPGYYNPPDGSLTVKGSAKAVGSTAGTFDLSIGKITVSANGCGSLGVLPGLTKCLSWYIGSTQYYSPVGSGLNPVVPQQIPNTVSTAPTSNNLQLLGLDISGATVVVGLNLTASLSAPATATLPTVANFMTALAAAGINAIAGITYELDIYNSSSGAFNWTLATNTGWTLVGTSQTIAQNTMRRYYVRVQSTTAATITSAGGFTVAATP